MSSPKDTIDKYCFLLILINSSCYLQTLRCTLPWVITITTQRVSFLPVKASFMRKLQNCGRNGWIQSLQLLLKKVHLSFNFHSSLIMETNAHENYTKKTTKIFIYFLLLLVGLHRRILHRRTGEQERFQNAGAKHKPLL